ncbi:MAG: hypothetical protein JSS95_07580 [Acidobacteria bacterium]|nr:hypothetical protein [Acidobacteriota bacterium]
MRKTNKNKANFVQEISVASLTEKVDQLEKRVAALEKHFILPGGNDSAIDLSDSRCKLTPDGIGEPAKIAAIAKRGRPRRIPLDQFERRRDELVIFIEVRWPDLRDAMRKVESIHHLLDALKRASPGALTNWPYLHLKENIGKLWEFLHDGRCKGEPRQIAYAMAGVPEMAAAHRSTIAANILPSCRSLMTVRDGVQIEHIRHALVCDEDWLRTACYYPEFVLERAIVGWVFCNSGNLWCFGPPY